MGNDEPLSGARPASQLTPLHQVNRHIGANLRQNAEAAFLITTAVALAGALLGWFMPLNAGSADPGHHPRAMAALQLGIASALALIISKARGPRWGIAWFAASSYALSTGWAIWLGVGVASAASTLPIVLVVILGFALGPRAAQAATALACLGTLAMLGLQTYGLIPGMQTTNRPPAGAYATVQILVFLMIGITISRYSTLLWDALKRLDLARDELQTKVDAQTQTQQALLESRQRLNTLLDHVPLAVLIFTPKSGRLHYANHHALQAHGANTAEALEALCLYPPETPTSRQDLREAFAAVRTLSSFKMKWRSRHADGHPIWWEVDLHTMQWQGSDHMVAYAQDITARLKAEDALKEHQEHLEEQVRDRTRQITEQQRRLEDIIDALPVAMVIKDKTGRHQLSNRYFEKALGRSKSDIIGRYSDELHAAALAEKITQEDRALFEGTPSIRYELTQPGANGTELDFLITKVPLLNSQGQPESVLTLAVDISDIKALQRELAEAKTEAERLTRIMSEFLANMSHEIRTPLHGVLGMAQIGRARGTCDDGTLDVFEKITKSGHHLLGIIDAILDFSKIEAGKMVINECAVDPTQLAKDALSMVEAKAKDKGLTLTCDAPAALPTVMVDPLRLEQILLNLLSNAVKFTAQGGISLSVQAQDQWMHFRVRDTGIGMHPDTQHRAFQPFEQADGSTSRRFGGTGLGLSISRQLARLMGGEITLESQLGSGATFTLTLPLKTTNQAPSHQPLALAPGRAQAQQARLKGVRILAVDDVAINREIVSELLAHEQADTTIAEDGKQALTLIKAHGPGWYDLVLMDIQMPVMNGMQATELLHMIDPTLPVVALTAHALEDECQRFKQAGMTGHLAKPFEPEGLIQAALQHARARSTAQAQAQAPEDQSPALGIDLPSALRRCGGKEALLRKLVKRFSDEQADFSQRCATLMATNPDDARRLAHMLKGTSANLGLPTLAHAASELESALSKHDLVNGQTALQVLATTLQAHLATLSTWLQDEPLTA
jgi:PAS domain S-box-containing protein